MSFLLIIFISISEDSYRMDDIEYRLWYDEDFEDKIEDLKKVSDIKKVIINAFKYFNDNSVKVYVSTRKNKKFMIKTPEGKWSHFGDIRYEDFTKSNNKEKRDAYINRASNIRGNWSSNKYSPNNMALAILWQ